MFRLAQDQTTLFQSLTWVERLSDRPIHHRRLLPAQFQSLTWVERLSDTLLATLTGGVYQFQSLTWVERLSDAAFLVAGVPIDCFNPSPGLNVFQTRDGEGARLFQRKFQSLTWVERLSDCRCSREPYH